MLKKESVLKNCDCESCECEPKKLTTGKLEATFVSESKKVTQKFAPLFQKLADSELEDKKQEILKLVGEFVQMKRGRESFTAGQDWVKYSGPYFDEKEYQAAVESLLSEWLIFGENARNFEQTFSPLMGKKFGVLTNSGSSANLLMVSALTSKRKTNKWFLPKGSKILTPVVCFPTTINPIIQNGYEPVFIDVELPSLNIDLGKVEKHLRDTKHLGYEMPKAIMFAHVLGNPPDMDRLEAICKEYDLIFLEDACDALGSTYDGKKLGTFGLMSTCSFFPAHHMTMGEGGFVSTNENRLRTILASFRDWGRDCFCNEKKPGDVTSETACGRRLSNWLPGCPDAVYDHRYTFSEIGFNLKPLDLQAAMGLQQIDKLPEMEQARRDNYQKLMNIFKPYDNHLMLVEPTAKSDPCWFGFLITVKDGAPFRKEELVNHLEANKIQTRSYFSGNILYHAGYKHLMNLSPVGLKMTFPNAHKVTMDTFFLGTFIGLTDEKLQYVKKVVDEYMNEFKEK